MTQLRCFSLATFSVAVGLWFVALSLIFAPVSALRAQNSYATPYTFTTIASTPTTGALDGVGGAARFNFPFGTAVDAGGNVYVADAYNFTIRKITAAGVVTTLAGSPGLAGSADGTGSAARFGGCWGVAVDPSGNVYATDSKNHTIRRITAAGVVTTFAGSAGISGSANGAGSAARFSHPQGIAVDGSGNIYVSDFENATIRRITPDGAVTTLAGSPGATGSTNGTGAAARFGGPAGIAVDGSGNVYVADANNYIVRKITSAGVVSTLAGSAGQDGEVNATGAAARFRYLSGLAVDGSGNVYVADEENAKIRKITPAGVVTSLAGADFFLGSTDGLGLAARFMAPEGVAVDASGNLYVADAGASNIRKITSAGVVSTLAGAVGGVGLADGIGPAARFSIPWGVAVDSNANVYLADAGNNLIRKISSSGVVTTLAGTAGVFPDGTDGAGSAARFNFPSGIAVDGSGNMFVTDFANHLIRKITPAGVVTTIAGAARTFGRTDGIGSVARFDNPVGIAVDGNGNLFVADRENENIRMITPAGVVSTFAGSTSGVKGATDGTGNAARFDSPTAIAIDGSGNLYVGDKGNATIRKITPARVVTTLAGLAGSRGSADGTGPNARFGGILSVAADASGNVYVGDGDDGDGGSYNFLIRKITPAGVVTTIAGSLGVPGAADGTGATATVTRPGGIAVAANGTLYLSDMIGSTIRKGVLAIDPPTITTQPAAVSITAGAAASFTVAATSAGPLSYQWRKNGTAITGATNATYAISSTQISDSGSYTVVVTNAGGSVTSNAATLTVAPNFAGTYFGSFGGNRGSFALVVRSDGVGTFVGFLNNPRSGIVATVSVLPDGTFRTESALIQPQSGIGGRPVAAAATPFILSGSISATSVTGSLDGLGVTFAGTLEPTVGAPSPLAGIYQATGAGSGTTYVVIGGAGRTVLAMTIGPTLVDGGLGSIASNGTFSVTTPDNTRITGTVVPATGGITATTTPSAGSPTNATGSVTGGLGAPIITNPPVAQTVTTGASITLTLTVGGRTPLAYQWKRDGIDIVGATNAAYVVAAAQVADAGSYTCVITNSDGRITSAPAALTIAASARIVNLSILTDIPTAGSSFTLGYVLGGTGVKPLIIRAAGPSLGALGVAGTLDDPKFELFAGTTKTGENDNWGGSAALTSAIAAVGAFPFTGPTSRDAATVANVTTSNNSVVVSAAGTGIGTVIAEVYDATPNDAYTATTPRLVNVSVIKQIGTGFTVGFVLGGSGSKGVLIRAVGPGLAAVGVSSGFLPDPKLTLFTGATKTDENDNWGGTSALTAAMTQTGAFAIPATSADAALLATLQPGQYSARVDGATGTTGLVLVEVYEVP